jgi:hypothetical protein
MNKKKILLAMCTSTLLLTMAAKVLAQQSNEILILEKIKQSDSDFIEKQSFPLSPTISQQLLAQNDNTTVQKVKKETDWNLIVTALVSISSLVVSSAVAYTSNLRQADIQLCFSRDLIFSPIFIKDVSGNDIFKGVGFNLPLTFYNWSPQGGTIQRIRLVINKYSHDDKLYDMAWTTFVKITEAGDFVNDNLAQPISVKGHSSINKVIKFDWISEQDDNNSFDVQSGKYELMIFGWTKSTEKPDLKYETFFNLKEEHYKIFNHSMLDKKNRAIWVLLEENEQQNQLLPRNSIKRLYLQ